MDNLIIEFTKILAGGLTGFLLKGWLDKRAEIETREYKAKEERY